MALKITVTGSDVTDVPKALYQHKFLREWKTKGKIEFVQVFVIESYSLRVNSTLTVFIILEFESESYVHITISASGGATLCCGDWGAERSREMNVYEHIRRLAQKRGWELSGYN